MNTKRKKETEKLFGEDESKKKQTVINNPENQDPFGWKLKNIYETFKQSSFRFKYKFFDKAELHEIDAKDPKTTYKLLKKKENCEANGIDIKLKQKDIEELYKTTGITGINPGSSITELGNRFRNVYIEFTGMERKRQESFKKLSPGETIFVGMAIENDYTKKQLKKARVPEHLKTFISEAPEKEKIKASELLESNTIKYNDYEKAKKQPIKENTEKKAKATGQEAGKEYREASELLQKGDQQSLIKAGTLIREHNIDKNLLMGQIPENSRAFIKNFAFGQAIKLAGEEQAKTLEKTRTR